MLFFKLLINFYLRMSNEFVAAQTDNQSEGLFLLECMENLRRVEAERAATTSTPSPSEGLQQIMNKRKSFKHFYHNHPEFSRYNIRCQEDLSDYASAAVSPFFSSYVGNHKFTCPHKLNCRRLQDHLLIMGSCLTHENPACQERDESCVLGNWVAFAPGLMLETEQVAQLCWNYVRDNYVHFSYEERIAIYVQVSACYKWRDSPHIIPSPSPHFLFMSPNYEEQVLSDVRYLIKFIFPFFCQFNKYALIEGSYSNNYDVAKILRKHIPLAFSNKDF